MCRCQHRIPNAASEEDACTEHSASPPLAANRARLLVRTRRQPPIDRHGIAPLRARHGPYRRPAKRSACVWSGPDSHRDAGLPSRTPGGARPGAPLDPTDGDVSARDVRRRATGDGHAHRGADDRLNGRHRNPPLHTPADAGVMGRLPWRRVHLTVRTGPDRYAGSPQTGCAAGSDTSGDGRPRPTWPDQHQRRQIISVADPGSWGRAKRRSVAARQWGTVPRSSL